jgi:crotonobetainyl-CoA:carnitine CoA-transferase CaiB-like acyl-CoA transferase
MKPRGLHRLARVLGKRATLGAMSTIACAAVLAACGEESKEDEGFIPAQTGENILLKLDEVQARFDDGKCDEAAASAAQIQAAVAGIQTVKGDLEEALVKASDNLVTLVREDCEPAEEKIPEEEEDPTGTTGEEGVVP